MNVFTLGYQGLKLDSYTYTLQASNVGIVIDVRETPWSYNRQYIKSIMQNALLESGIEYLHLRECGNPSANRKSAKSVEECLANYRKYLGENPKCLDILFEQIKVADNEGRPACLTCYEKSPHECHRTILLDFLVEKHTNLNVIHLQGLGIESFTKINHLPLFSDTINQLS